MTHPHYSTGMPCDCTFTAHLGRQASIAKEAGKLHDFLMNPKSRPDLQTPDGQRWLKMLARMHELVGDKLDPLTPWLTREWKKGRIIHSPDGEVGHPYYRWMPPEDQGDVDHWRRQPLTQRELSHWADFYGSNHPLRRDLGDIMVHHVQPFHDRVKAWDDAMSQEAQDQALKGGEVVHTTPDNWTVRKLATPEELTAEGDAMGHCVGGYCDDVQSGRSLIYSLRDPEGRPHATAEISPGYTTSGVRDPNWLERFLSEEPKTSLQRGMQHTPEVVKGLREYERQMLEMQEGMRQKYDPEVSEHQGLYNTLAAEHVNGHRRSDLPLQAHPENGTIVQIQGKSNATPLPEYQKQLKHWFQSFPEETRPNWETPGHAINHVGALVPDAETWDPHYGIAHVGEPDGGDGGYGAHGDYGLVTPQRDIDYDATIASLARPKTYEDHREGVDRHNADEAQAIYQEAVRRGEIPQFAKAVQAYGEQAQSDRDAVEDHMYDVPHYPGESYDEEPERWDQVAAEDPNQYMDGNDAFEEARRAYDYHQDNLDAEHVPTQITNDLYRHLNQHKYRGSGMGPHGDPGGYQNELKSGGQLLPNDQQLKVSDLPQGAQYTDLGGGVWTQGEQDKYYNPNLVPPHVALPPPPQQPLAKLASGAPDPYDLTTFPVGQHDQALQEALNNPTRLQYTYRPDLDKEDWGGNKRYHYDVTPVGAPAMHEAVKYDRLRRFGYDPELVDPDDESEAAQFRTQWRWKGHPEWRREMYRDPETGADSGFNEEVQGRPDHLYRGMSHEEFEDAKARGYFDSNRSYNLGEEGTLFSTDPTQARSYATGFAPWHRKPGYSTPSYVIEVPRPQDAFPHPNQSSDTTEIVAPSRVPFDQATRAWQFRPYATLVDDMQMRTENGGKSWDGRPYFDHYYAYRPYPIDRQVTSADLNPNIRQCPYCKGERTVDAPQLLPEMPYLNMSTGEQGHGVWFDGARDVCPECHGMGHTGLGRDQPPPLAQTDEHMNQWGGFSQDYNVDPKSLPPLGTPKQGATATPLYKRWVFSPASGEVTLGDNTSAEPKYHTDLAREINEPNLIHGYAYRIGNGWRLTDWDSQPLDDTYVVAQVMRALAGDQAPSGPQDGSWSPQDQDWARVHHGLPS